MLLDGCKWLGEYPQRAGVNGMIERRFKGVNADLGRRIWQSGVMCDGGRCRGGGYSLPPAKFLCMEITGEVEASTLREE